MRARRLGHRKDRNHDEIAGAFVAHGATWADTYQLGDGFPDGIAGYMGLSVPVEIKDPTNPPSKQKLTDDEAQWHAKWKGSKAIIRSEADARALIDRMSRDALLLAAGGSHPA
jgi:hypothetical protein